MKHRFWPVLLLAAGACAGRGPSAPVASGFPAAAQDEPGWTDSAAAVLAQATDSDGRGPDARVAGDAVVDPETSDSLQLAADSAADADILERLATARPEAGESGAVTEGPEASDGGTNAVATSAVTWDIDVETFNSHNRVQYYLDFFQGTARERMAIWLTRLPRYEAMIRERLREHGVPEDMIYLALIESGFSNTAVSRSRAVGMWQFMKGTAKLYGLRVDQWVDERRDPYKATEAAARHLSDLRDRFGSLYLAAAAYNAGAGKVGRGLARLKEDDEETPDASFFRLYDTKFLRRETKDYVPKLIAAALIAKQPDRYGFGTIEPAAMLHPDSILVPDMTGLDVIARLADTTVAAIRELNPQYLRLATPPRATSVVRVPAGRGEMVALAYAKLPANQRITFREHYVSRGETLGRIAGMYHVSVQAITDANPRLKPKALQVGQRVIIPTSGFVPSREVLRSVEDRPSSRTVARSDGYHRVRAGESLWTISQAYHLSVAQLRAWNALDKSATLRVGQRLRIRGERPSTADPPGAPTAGPSVHVVKRGETLSGVARQYGVPLSALRQANGLDEGSVLKAGSRLRIPS